ncbi:MAG: 1-acyl-sn-glycerol-3-phosphate acyltransferase [Gemmatimonadales bacterium]
MTWPVAAAAILTATAAASWAGRRLLRRWAARTVLRFRARLDRHKLTESRRVKDELAADPVIAATVARLAVETGESAVALQARVRGYADEIVPFFNVLSYYRLGYTLARMVTRLFYRVTVLDHDARAHARTSRRDVMVYLSNHRSNMDYVVVSFVLAQSVSISYAVGEWARTWPLEHLFKSFGSYFVRRNFRDPLYHLVLERYVQLVTRNRVTQGLFPEGGLTRDGTLRPPKIGLLDYLVGTLRDPGFDGDLWLVPVAINYDRVLEDRTLTRELDPTAPPRSRIRQLAGWVGFAIWNGMQLLTGRGERYGQVAVAFGAPISVRDWLAAEAPDALEAERSERLPVILRLAEHVMARTGAAIPVTPVPFAALALLSFHDSVVPLDALWDRMAEWRGRLRAGEARLVPADLTVTEVWDRAWRSFRSRHWLHREADSVVILPGARPLLEYYANSVRHLVAGAEGWSLSPAADTDESLPRLRPQEDRRR